MQGGVRGRPNGLLIGDWVCATKALQDGIGGVLDAGSRFVEAPACFRKDLGEEKAIWNVVYCEKN
jgi:hypothetical protein